MTINSVDDNWNLVSGVADTISLSSTDPNQMSADDAARVMNYARKEQPQAVQQTIAEKPWFVKVLGNPVVMGALAVAASKLLSGQRRGA